MATRWAPARLNEDVASAQGIDPVLTDRLLLTPVSVDDTGELERLYSDPLVRHWTGPWTAASVEAWARGMEARWVKEGVGKWMAHGRSDGTLVGRGGLSRTVLDGRTVLEVGWVVRDELTGRGYATEIGRAALAWAAAFFPDLPVVSFTEVHNLASVAVMRRLGLHSSGVIHREGLVAGHVDLQPEAPFALYRTRAENLEATPSVRHGGP